MGDVRRVGGGEHQNMVDEAGIDGFVDDLRVMLGWS